MWRSSLQCSGHAAVSEYCWLERHATERCSSPAETVSGSRSVYQRVLLTAAGIPLDANYLRMYWTSFYQIYMIGTHGWTWSIQTFYNCSREVAVVTDFRCESPYPTFILYAGMSQQMGGSQYVQTLWNFLQMLPTTMAWSSSDEWWQCNMLCSFGFVHIQITSHNSNRVVEMNGEWWCHNLHVAAPGFQLSSSCTV